MDGFAVRATDTAGASSDSPISLRVAAHQTAGDTGARVEPGTAVRIMTGAPIPEGADAVVPVEHTNLWMPEKRKARPQAPGTPVEIEREASPGANVRRAGESVNIGDTFLEAGQMIRAHETALLISVGVELVNIHPLPRVGVISTGDEIVPSPEIPGPGQIRDSNRPGLLRRLAEIGTLPVDGGLVRDDPAALESRIARLLPDVDFLITSGGVSVGDKDFTRDVLARMGDVEAYAVAVKPGKPQVFGRIGQVPVFGLPGNPVSSMVVFDQFVLPALRVMAGRRDILPPEFNAELRGEIRRRPGRDEFARVKLAVEDGIWTASPTGPQGSGVLSSMTKANGYAMIPADAATLSAGAILRCQRFVRS